MGGVGLFASDDAHASAYQIKVPQHEVLGVLYSTSSQSNIMAPSETHDGYQIYYVDAELAPKSFTIVPVSGYGIKEIVDESGKRYTSAPRQSNLYASAMTAGVPVNVTTDALSNILTGTLTVNVIDDPSDIVVSVSTGAYTLKKTAADFNGKTLVVQYDPIAEGNWIAYRSNGQAIKFAKLDGTRCPSSTTLDPIRNSDGSYTWVSREERKANLSGVGGGHLLKLSVEYPDIDVPLLFEYEQDGGNETNPEYLADMIESVTINGTTITDKSWRTPGYTVKNGSTISVNMKPQSNNVWEWNGSWFNGVALASARTLCYVETDDPTDVHTYKIKGLLNNPWRFKIITDDPSKYKYSINGVTYALDGNPHLGEGPNFTAPLIKPYYDNTGATTLLYKVDAVTVNGQKIPLDANFGYTPSVMDEEITLNKVKYERNTPITIECEPAEGESTFSIVLDPYGLMRTEVPLTKGSNTVYVNLDEDDGMLPIDFVGQVFINKSRKYPWWTGTNGQSIYSLQALKDVKIVKVYGYDVPTSVITYNQFNTYSFRAYHDGEEVETGEIPDPMHGTAFANYEVLKSTKVKIVPEVKSGLVIDETEHYGADRILEQEANGEFNFTMDESHDVFLRADMKIGIKCPENYDKVSIGLFTEGRNQWGYNTIKSSEPETLTIDEVERRFQYIGTSDNYCMKVKLLDDNYILTTSFTNNGNAVYREVYSSGNQEFTIGGLQLKDIVTLKVEEKKTITYTVRVFPPKSLNLTEKNFAAGDYVDKNGKAVASPFSVTYRTYSNGSYTKVDLDYGLNKVELPEDAEYIKVGAQVSSSNSGYDFVDAPYDVTVYYYDTSSYSPSWSYDMNDQHSYSELYNMPSPTILTIAPEGYSLINIGMYDTNSFGGFTIHDAGMPDSEINGTMDDVTLFSGQNIRISHNSETMCAASFEFWEKDWSSNEKKLGTFEPNDKWDFNVTIPDDCTTGEMGVYHELTPQSGKMTLSFDFDESVSNLIIKDQDNTTYNTATAGKTIEMTLSRGLTITCSDKDCGISKIVDKATGQPLTIGAKNVVTGFKPGMELVVTMDKRERNKKVTFVAASTFSVAKTLTMAKGTSFEKTVTLGTNTEVQFCDEDLPFELELQSTSTTIYPRPVYYAYLFHNGELIVGSGNGRIQTLNDIQDGDVIRYSTAATTRPVTYDIEEGVYVNILHDGRKMPDTYREGVVPYSTIIKIQENTELNSVGYEVLRNGTPLTATQLKNGFNATNTNEEIVIRKTYTNLTFSGKDGADLSAVLVNDNLGNQYHLTSVDNSISVPSRAETISLLTADEVSFVSDVTTDPSTMTFDVKRGVLSNLATGSVSLAVKNVVRDKEATFYLHSSQLNGSSAVLADNSVIQSGTMLELGRHTVKYGVDDLPVVLRLSEEYVENAANAENPAALYVNGVQVEYSVEDNGFVLPLDAFKDAERKPIVKVYETVPEKVDVDYMVEEGISFSATGEDSADDVCTTAGEVTYLPGTEVTIEATAANGTDVLQLVIADEVVEEGNTISFKYVVGSYDAFIKIQHKKYPTKVTYVAGEGVQFTAEAPDYESTSVSGVKEYMPGTIVTLTASPTNPEQFIEVTVGDEVVAYGKNLEYHFVVGDEPVTLNINAVTFDRDKLMEVYVEEENGVEAAIIMSLDKPTQSEVVLKNGYQEVLYHNDDLPLAFRNVADESTPLTVYVNGQEIAYTEGVGYEFPAELDEKSVVKIFSQTQQTINLNYSITLEGYNIAVKHDRVTDIDLAQTSHSVLPGTEITLSVTVPEAQSMNVRAYEKLAKDTPIVFVNKTEVAPDENGNYVYKVTKADIDKGVNIEVASKEITALESIFVDGRKVDVYNLNGILVVRNAMLNDLKRLESGIYLVEGKKYMLRK